MLLVLDSNEFIFGFGAVRKPECEMLLDRILDSFPSHSVRLPRLIVEEVTRNLTPEETREFFGFLTSLTIIDEDFTVPFELGSKYEIAGLKPADAFIAAYTEWVGADALVSQNRHFLTKHPNLPFKVLTAEQCLKRM